MNTDLTGKVAFVTGGGSGIGAATSRTLAAAGAAVAIVDFRLDAAQSVAEEITAAGGRSPSPPMCATRRRSRRRWRKQSRNWAACNWSSRMRGSTGCGHRSRR